MSERGYEVFEVEGGVPIKAWPRGVAVEEVTAALQEDLVAQEEKRAQAAKAAKAAKAAAEAAAAEAAAAAAAVAKTKGKSSGGDGKGQSGGGRATAAVVVVASAGVSGGGLSQPTSILTAASVTLRSMLQPRQRNLATEAGWIRFGAMRRPLPARPEARGCPEC
jgi:hypothetical protein